MTKKDYVLIASACRKVWQQRLVAHKHTNECVCTLMANELEKENPAFQRGKFLVACLPPENVCESYEGSRKEAGCINCGGLLENHANIPHAKASRSTQKSRRGPKKRA